MHPESQLLYPAPASRQTPATCQDCHIPFILCEVFALDQWLGCGLCPACEALNSARILARQHAETRRLRLAKWQALEMPFQAGSSLTDLTLIPARQAHTALAWKYGPTGLVITGETGLGKSRTLVELLKDRWLEDGHECAFIRFTAWKQSLDRAHRYGGEGVEKFVRPFVRVPILAIDDLGHGKFTENNLACFFELLDARTSKGLPTHFTTQHSKASLKSAFDAANPKTSDAIIRRLEEFQRLITFSPVNDLRITA